MTPTKTHRSQSIIGKCAICSIVVFIIVMLVVSRHNNVFKSVTPLPEHHLYQGGDDDINRDPFFQSFDDAPYS